jgi:ATP-binding cassette subfamily B protein
MPVNERQPKGQGERSMKSKLFSPQDKQNLSWFFKRYLKPYAWQLMFIFVLIVVQGVVYQQFLSLTEKGLRVIFEKGSLAELARICAITLAIFLFRALGSYLIPVNSAKIANRATFELRRDLTGHLVQVKQSYFDANPPGEVILRLVNQVQALGSFVSQASVNAMRDFITILVVSGYLIYKSAFMFAFALIVIPLIALAINLTSQRIKQIQSKSEAATGEYLTSIDEMATGMRTIKLSSQETSETNRLNGAAQTLHDLAIRLQRANAIMLPIIDLASAMFFILVIGIGGYIALQGAGNLDGAGIISFLLGLVILFDPAKNLGAFFVKIQSNLILLQSVRGVLFLDIEDRTDKIELDTSTPVAMSFDRVDFAYADGTQVIHDVSLDIAAGKTTAIVGATGSGKSTILALIGRLYDRTSGQISVNGTPINELTLASLRNAINIVAQDIVIFNKSIYENIAYAKPDAPQEAILAAAEKAQILDLLTARGDAPVGPKGAHLSGGQKQRIAIARAFLKDTPILILDEATSALDPVTETLINDAFFTRNTTQTRIVVTHKLASITGADMIYVVDGGRVVERGTHDVLMAQAGLYYAMFTTQNDAGDAD